MEVLKLIMQEAIENALNNLYNSNQMLFDYWCSELFDENDNRIESNWNEENLEMMEHDVMYQSQA